MMSSWDQYVSVGKCVYKKLGWSFTQFPLLMKGRDSQTKIRGGPVSPCTSYQLLGRMSHPSDSHLSWVVRQQNRCRKTARVCWEKQQIRIPGKKKTQKKTGGELNCTSFIKFLHGICGSTLHPTHRFGLIILTSTRNSPSTFPRSQVRSRSLASMDWRITRSCLGLLSCWGWHFSSFPHIFPNRYQ